MKLSSVTLAEQCNDTLRSMLKFLPDVQKPWKVNIIVSPATLRDLSPHVSHKETAPYVYNNLYSFGEGGGGWEILLQRCFPPLVGVKMGLLGMHPITHLQGGGGRGTIQYKIDPRMADQPWLLFVCNSHFEAIQIITRFNY